MPPGPIITKDRNFKLTGRVRFRDAIERAGMLRGSRVVVIEVEEEFDRAFYSAPPRNENDLLWTRYARWRDTTPLDMADPALRWLIDGPVSQNRPKSSQSQMGEA